MDGKDYFDDYHEYYSGDDDDAPIYDPNDICDFREEQEEEDYEYKDQFGRTVYVHVDRFGNEEETLRWDPEIDKRMYGYTGKQFCTDCKCELKYMQVNPKRKSKRSDYWECPICHFSVSAQEVVNGDYNFPTLESIEDPWNEYFDKY